LFELLALAVNFLLIAVDLLILFVGLIFAALQLIADNRPGTQTKCRSDSCARAGMTDRGTDKAAGGCAT
jgi:hypothetical protein